MAGEGKEEVPVELREQPRRGEDNEAAVDAMRACYRGFDPVAYLQFNYTPPRADFQRADSIVPWKLTCLHRAFTEGRRARTIHRYIIYISAQCMDQPPLDRAAANELGGCYLTSRLKITPLQLD